MPLGADQPRDLRFHERLREYADALPQHIAILLLEELANKRRPIHSGLRHRVNTSEQVREALQQQCSAQSKTTGQWWRTARRRQTPWRQVTKDGR